MAILEPPGLRERKRVRTRDTIARAALDLFDRQGFARTTIHQVAEAAEVSPRTVSAYFPHKEDLAFPHNEELLGSLAARLGDRQPGESATDALRAWIESWMKEDAGLVAERAVRRRVVRAHEGLRAYEHRFTLRAQEIIAAAIAEDLGASPGDLEPRMAAAATLTIFELLGDDHSALPGAGVDAHDVALAVVDRALLFIGGGIRALRDAAVPEPEPRPGRDPHPPRSLD